MVADSDAQSAHLRLALALHHKIGSKGENLCFSPYSVASGLSLLATGAEGRTARELVNLLTGSDDGIEQQERLLCAAARLPAGQPQHDPVLAVSNTLWAWDGLPVKQDFLHRLRLWPAGAVAGAPFRDDPEAAREIINSDVSERTMGLIPELLPFGAVHADTVASLVNALYLRSAWLCPFEPAGTADGEFHTATATVSVPMMAQTEELGYAETAQWQAVGLPAAGGIQAVILLPRGDLGQREGELDEAVLTNLLDGLAPRMVSLLLPKLHIDVRSRLSAALGELGVRELFTPRAALGGISEDDRLYVDSILHQAVLRVDESGLEGAAATAAMMRLVSMPLGGTVEMRVDRPFLLLIRHVDTGALYFLARVMRP